MEHTAETAHRERDAGHERHRGPAGLRPRAAGPRRVARSPTRSTTLVPGHRGGRSWPRSSPSATAGACGCRSALMAGLLALFVARMWPGGAEAVQAAAGAPERPSPEGGHLLSWVLGIPIASAVAILFLPRQAHGLLRGATLLVDVRDARRGVAAAASVPMGRGYHFNEDVALDAALRHPLPRRDRRHLALARAADRLHHAHRGLRVVRPDREAAQGLVLRAAPARGRDARRVSRARPVPLLRVLGADAHPDVRHDRRLGRDAAASRARSSSSSTRCSARC